MSRLKQLQLDLADPAVREALHAELARASPEQLLQYYSARPALAQYTLEMELTRMEYHVVSREGGAALTAPEPIRALYAADAAEREAGGDQGPELLWRMANQSLFAGALEAVHRRIVACHDGGGTLCLAATTERATFDLDLRRGRLRATADLSLTTLSGRGQARLVLATVVLAVDVNMFADGAPSNISQLVEKLQPEVVFDDQLEVAAVALAELSPEGEVFQNSRADSQAGFASVRAATALGTLTASALGAAATVSASALGAATQGLRGLSLNGIVSPKEGSAREVPEEERDLAPGSGSCKAKLAEADFDDFFDSIECAGTTESAGMAR